MNESTLPPSPEHNSLRLLREQLLQLTYRCPKGTYVGPCPFGKFSGVSHGSRQSMLARLSKQELTDLFDLASGCRCPDDPRNEKSAPHTDLPQ